jgi:hypothetical protein
MAVNREKDDLCHIYRGESRVAKVYNTSKGFEVDLYENDVLLKSLIVHEHSENYAEDCAENWVQGLIE